MKARPELKNDCQKLWNEANELTLIFAKILITLNKKLNIKKLN